MKERTVALLVAIILVLSVALGQRWSERLMAQWAGLGCGCSQTETALHK